MGQSHRERFEEGKLRFGSFQIPPALKSLNVCCFVMGESVSFFGSWMTQIALVWMVYQLTNSAVLVGVAGFTNQALGLIITPLVGVLLDRWNLRYVLLTTQLLNVLLSSLLTFLTLNGQLNVVWIIIIGALQGTLKAFDLPARLVTIPRLVEDKTETYSAISLHSFSINTAKFASPMIAGILLASSGATACFLIDAITYIPFISAILTTKIRAIPNKLSSDKTPFLKTLKEGFVFAYDFLPIKYAFILQIIICFMAMTHVNLMPIFTQKILNGNAETMGFLMTASALGSIVAGFYLILRKQVIGLEKIITRSTAILGLGLMLFSRSNNLEICLVLIFLVGMSNTLTLASIGNFVQSILTDEDKRGRVTSIFTTGFLGVLPFGNLFFGGLTNQIGVANAIFFGGACCLLGAFYFSRQESKMRRILHSVYLEMGLTVNSDQ
ncbi:MFS transporter [Scytonema hofmannii PCC 7110]|uniref:MFS transporter n=1 Tax=Scytonema hofmannii PCC 7110 TaxID=128403 RepID=A0A139X397_9CYAN|nr:MFS transporter [Scytonema hofmannii]KYC34453.1 MFS transporter [Scytonema hofmannii PCC 7110]KYC39144.1 MFS transporter [Scytonema hofmannii PCC 7110]